MQQDFESVLFSEEQIRQKVRELAERISHDYMGKELLVIGILKGSVFFLSDLVRNVAIPVCIDFMAISSYGASSRSSGVVRILKDLEQGIEGRHVLIVEDIIDTGLTLSYLLDNLATRGPASLKICTLLDKPARRIANIEVDYNGFTIEDHFVVGYGLDYNEHYRNHPCIMILSPKVYKGGEEV